MFYFEFQRIICAALKSKIMVNVSFVCYFEIQRIICAALKFNVAHMTVSYTVFVSYTLLYRVVVVVVVVKINFFKPNHTNNQTTKPTKQPNYQTTKLTKQPNNQLPNYQTNQTTKLP